MHDCLVPVTAWLGNLFESLRKTGKIPGKVRAMDMRHILLLLPFLLHNLLQEEVEEYNSKNPFNPVCDPSNECIGIVLLLLEWYQLYRRRYPPKDEIDIQELQTLSLRHSFIRHILLIVLTLLSTIHFYRYDIYYLLSLIVLTLLSKIIQSVWLITD